MNINNIISIVSVFLLIIISYLTINSTIYNKPRNIEFFHDDDAGIDTLKKKDILTKCPRGCGFHDIYVPSCDLCTSNKPDYDKATVLEKSNIDIYHIEGDKQESYTLNLIDEWRKINTNSKFVFTIPIYDRNDNTIMDYKTINIHPYYQKILYSKFNNENNDDILKITQWINNTFNKEIIENAKNIYPFPEILSNWKYISNEPSDYIKNELDYIIRLKYHLLNNDITESPGNILSHNDGYITDSQDSISITDSDITNDPIIDDKIDIFDLNDNFDIVVNSNRLNTKDELIKNINKPLINSYKYANKRWSIFNINTDNDELPSIDNYIIKILDNIKNGKGLHINDIICLTKLDRDTGLKYLNKLRDILIIEESERNKKIKEYLNYNKLSTNGYFKYTLKSSCKNNDSKDIYTEIKINDMNSDIVNKEVVLYNKFWPIFDRSSDFFDINQNNLTKEFKKLDDDTDTDTEKYDEDTQICYDNLCGNNKGNGIECLFLSKLSKID